MQRIISLQTSRNADRASSEFVTKRLCCSFLFSVGFLSLLGGFLLGRYATDRAILLKNVALQQRQRTEEKFSLDMLNNLSAAMRDIHQLAADVRFTPNELHVYFAKLHCNTTTSNLPADAWTMETSNAPANVIPVQTTHILNKHLEVLSDCFSSIHAFLEQLQLQHSGNYTTPILTGDS